MNGTMKRLFIAGAAIISLSAALLASGASQAQSRSHAGATVASGADTPEPTNVSPASFEASIRGQGY